MPDPALQTTGTATPTIIGVDRAPTPPGVSRRGLRVVTAIACHPVLDAYAGFVPPILGLLEVRCQLSPLQVASLLSIGPIVSGLCQPLFAWLTDRCDTRLFGTVGLAIAAVALSSIGLADRFVELVALFTVGMLGVGAFHPVAAASVGQLAGTRRSLGVTFFFVAGMLGATLGPLISSRVASISPGGFDLLRWAMIPGIVCAVVLHLAVRDVSHHQPTHEVVHFERQEIRLRWRTIAVLFAGNACRFSVNIALLYIFVRWAQHVAAQAPGELAPRELAVRGAIYCGELNALMMLGMGIGGLAAGMFVRAGRERLVFILVPLMLAPAIAIFPLVGRGWSYPLASMAGIAYASVIPVSIALAQRLLPHRTSLASSLMMGGAWAVAVFAPPATHWLITVIGLAPTFAAIAALLALSGVIGLLLPGDLIRRVAEGNGAVAPDGT